MKVGIIVQARMNSSRVPKKMAVDFGGKPLLWHSVSRLKKLKSHPKIIIATGPRKQNQWIFDFGKRNDVEVFSYRDENDTLSRFYLAAKKYKFDQVVRICADNMFVCAEELDHLIKEHIKSGVDFSRNVFTLHPDLGAEIVTFAALEKAYREASTAYDREHVMPYIYKTNPQAFKLREVPPKLKWPIQLKNLKFVVDTPNDVTEIRKIVGQLFNGRTTVATKQLIEFIKQHD